MRLIVTVALVLVGIIHLLPLSGVLGAERLAVLYGVVASDADLLILLRHRAVLFGMLGVLFVVAGFVRALQPTALVLGFVSVLSFLLLAWSVGGYSAQIGRVVIADVVALVLLVAGTVAWAVARRSHRSQ